MSGESVTKEIAPKRKRMMDMILALGNLKEEAAIPLSKVNEEIANLKREIEPLVNTIVEFPETYFQQVHESVVKYKLVNQVSDRAILSESILNIDEALTHGEFTGLSDTKTILQETIESMTTQY